MVTLVVVKAPQSLRFTSSLPQVYNLGLYLGFSCALGPGARIAHSLGWRAAFACAGAAGAPLVLLVLALHYTAKACYHTM